MSDDLISRAEAIKAVKFYETFCDPYPRVIEALEELPSVHPDKDLIHLQKEQAYMQGYVDGQKPRKGKWKIQGNRGICSECHKYIYLGYDFNYCPNCGADMRERKEDGRKKI